ncbi:MAG TPA: DUF5667 domain-containing protein [Candidatus Paceibacterota bacterium]|nr:DUF5667 domain-containing protein [Candidatus Paceibacterota bacterium]
MHDTENNDALSPIREISLAPGEKRRIRLHLEAYIDVQSARTSSRSRGGWFSHHVGLAVVVLIAVTAGGTVTLAHWSGPDGFFYPFRKSVTERVELALTFDDEERLDKEMEQLERALGEEELFAEREFAALAAESVAEERNEDEEENEDDDDRAPERDAEAQRDMDDFDRELNGLEKELREFDREAEDELG